MTGPKRVTEKQLAANRRNARKSTGPRTPQGKAVSRWNALKHGVLAQAVIPLPLEDYESRADFDALLAALVADLDPASPLEEMLVERMATCYWRMGRILRAEGAAIAKRQDARIHDAAQPRWDELFSGIGQSNRLPSTADRLRNLENAMSNKARLRALMVDDDPNWREATDEALSAGARELLAQLGQQLSSSPVSRRAPGRLRRPSAAFPTCPRSRPSPATRRPSSGSSTVPSTPSNGSSGFAEAISCRHRSRSPSTTRWMTAGNQCVFYETNSFCRSVGLAPQVTCGPFPPLQAAGEGETGGLACTMTISRSSSRRVHQTVAGRRALSSLPSLEPCP